MTRRHKLYYWINKFLLAHAIISFAFLSVFFFVHHRINFKIFQFISYFGKSKFKTFGYHQMVCTNVQLINISFLKSLSLKAIMHDYHHEYNVCNNEHQTITTYCAL